MLAAAAAAAMAAAFGVGLTEGPPGATAEGGAMVGLPVGVEGFCNNREHHIHSSISFTITECNIM